jgi:ferritin-like metal-binding protein YciE
MNRTVETQLQKYLTDVHSIEEQALVQMRRAPDIAQSAEIAGIFERHLAETEGHEEAIANLLESHNGSPSALKDAAGAAGGVGMVLFAKLQPDTPGKLVAHAFSYEHMELAAYELLGRVAAMAGDEETESVAARIGAEEQAMADRLASCFDEAVEASLDKDDPDYLGERLDDYLADAHAIEEQAIGLLKQARKVAGNEHLARLFSEHLEETEDHERRVAARREGRGASTSNVKDAALRLGALNLGAFLAAQPDTPAKLAGFAFAFEHLEVASYELLRRLAAKAGDAETASLAGEILAEERAAAEKIASQWDRAIEASLDALDVSA